MISHTDLLLKSMKDGRMFSFSLDTKDYQISLILNSFHILAF